GAKFVSAGALRWRHQKRQYLSALRGDQLEAAGQTGEIGMGSGRGRRHCDLAALHRGVRPGHAAARTHCNAHIRRWHVTGDATVSAMRATVGDRNNSEPQTEIEIFL